MAMRSSSEFGSCPEGEWSGRTGCSTLFCIGSSGSGPSRPRGEAWGAGARARTNGSRLNAGLATDEAFLIAVKRMGDLDALSREFAREHSERLWKQLVAVPSVSGEPRARGRTDAIAAFGFAVAAAVAVKVPLLFGIQMEQ